jgi:hypothetical protein
MPTENERENLQAMFDEMRATTKWNLDGEMLWSYFFTDPTEAKLTSAADALAKMGFTVVGVDEAEFEDEHEHVHDENCAHGPDAAEDTDDDNRKTPEMVPGIASAPHVHDEHCNHDHGDSDDKALFFVLQVDEIKHHTVDTLHARHIELRAFAAKHALDAFDGIEVGEVAKIEE